MCRSTKRRQPAEPEILFRLVRQEEAIEAGQDGFLEQIVEVALGPTAALQKRNLGRIRRQVPADRLMAFTPPGRSRQECKPKKPKPSKKRRTSSGAKFLRLAQEWQWQLDAGEVESQAAIARRQGLTRARVCQIMSLLRLAPVLASSTVVN